VKEGNKTDDGEGRRNQQGRNGRPHCIYFIFSLGTPALSDWVLSATWGRDKEGGSGAVLHLGSSEGPTVTALWLEHKPN
jgi:hypothetical protein